MPLKGNKNHLKCQSAEHMETSSTKKLILSRIRKALAIPTTLPYPRNETELPIFPEVDDDLSVIFATEFSRLLGQFAYCRGEEDLVAQLSLLIQKKGWQNIYTKEMPFVELFRRWGLDDVGRATSLADCDVSVTGCEALVARTGSILLSAAQPEGRTTSVYAPVHVCIAWTSQLVYDIRDGLAMVQQKYAGNLPSSITLATGPSRTADIEKTLVVGVHGPKEVYCFLVEG